ncbi:hypothetical protein E2C01_076231 [Portunus trituberculatus]|uniref:Uncharacterized protein n=1 Tax=Portunus trituberculatus TaxID=210409 RepID=A0A5B7IHB4_PORTR|nr:hypothetical protein [Portunus trituberculatus]
MMSRLVTKKKRVSTGVCRAIKVLNKTALSSLPDVEVSAPGWEHCTLAGDLVWLWGSGARPSQLFILLPWSINEYLGQLGKVNYGGAAQRPMGRVSQPGSLQGPAPRPALMDL